jgi:hypothetical protein
MRNAWSRRMLEKIGQRAHSPRERYRDRPVYFLPDEAPQSPAGTLSDEEFIARWLDKSRAIWGQAEPDPQAWPYEDLGKWPIPSTALACATGCARPIGATATRTGMAGSTTSATSGRTPVPTATTTCRGSGLAARPARARGGCARDPPRPGRPRGAPIPVDRRDRSGQGPRLLAEHRADVFRRRDEMVHARGRGQRVGRGPAHGGAAALAARLGVRDLGAEARPSCSDRPQRATQLSARTVEARPGGPATGHGRGRHQHHGVIQLRRDRADRHIGQYLEDGVVGDLVDAYLAGWSPAEMRELFADGINDPSGFYTRTMAEPPSSDHGWTVSHVGS